MKYRSSFIICFLWQTLVWTTTALVNHHQVGSQSIFHPQGRAGDSAIHAKIIVPANEDERIISAPTSRREVLQGAVTAALLSTPIALSPGPAIAAAEQRCDPEDVRCQQDGTLAGEAPTGQPIPKVTNKITHVVQMIIDVGERREEAGFIRFGLYGEDCPQSTKQMLLFLTRGISSMDEETLRNSIGLEYGPVSLTESGSVPTIYSGKAVDFGVSSQAKAYAKSRGVRTAGANFVPQDRPAAISEGSTRPHNVAGLISIPYKGIGYGGISSGVSPIDEAYESAFTITADATPAFDGKRRVIGQVIDDPSMQFLSRLASLPVQKGKGSGLLPGTLAGPPLLKVRVREIGVQKVGKQDKKDSGKKKKK
ncbi:unnamed protein product [Cylindrotheca closterium]|uniref:PPIase cyclophilin-type domain-containing protein n=1 Tax=Cylindrotheca closterium TaxID=2856 RepID=A0AAD2JN13_9STRA|nr:unnamed protein product [Cylindrotheca closterium]